MATTLVEETRSTAIREPSMKGLGATTIKVVTCSLAELNSAGITEDASRAAPVPIEPTENVPVTETEPSRSRLT